MDKAREEELEEILVEMSRATMAFYGAATKIHNHPFIEFTGLMNEYIDVCRRAMENGIDFTACSIHTDEKLPMASHQIKYAMEKIECIYSGQIELKESV